MMPAKSTSDQRTYSSMMNGVAGIASRIVGAEREARRRETATPGSRRALGAHGGALSRPLAGPQPVGPQPAPQRGAADPESACRLGQLALRDLERIEDRLALLLRERPGLVATRQEHHLPELRRALLQRARPAAQRHQALAQLIGAGRRGGLEPVDHTTRPLVGV